MTGIDKTKKWWFERHETRNEIFIRWHGDSTPRFGPIDLLAPSENVAYKVKVIADEVLELSLLKFDSSVNDFSTGFADVRCDGEAFCKCWFERRCRAESHSEDDMPRSEPGSPDLFGSIGIPDRAVMQQPSGSAVLNPTVSSTRGREVATNNGNKRSFNATYPTSGKEKADSAKSREGTGTAKGLSTQSAIRNTIESKRLGCYKIPTKKMVPPKEGRTTRVIDETYLQYLEAKIRANPNAVVAPLVANITLPPGNHLEEGNLEYYDFEMIGGNHSRLVFQRLLNSPIFKSNPAVTHRSAVVYANLSVEEAVVVGQEHNAAAEDHLASKFQDEVHLARNMLKRCTSSMKFSEHADGGDQFQQLLKRVFLIEHLDKAEQRKAMGTLGTLKMLSQMSVRCWEKVEEIFNLYEQMEVKGQKPTKNPQLGLPDCKKAKWQFLHNLPEQEQYELLTGLAQKELSFKEAEMKARHMKKEAKVKEALEQLFKQPYDAILKNRPQLGDAQMTEALARALPEHKRKLEITDEFSALCSVAKGTISEGGEVNVHGHKLTAQTYSASVGMKPEVVIWEASESDTSVQCEGLMSYVRTRITGTSCNDSPVTVVVLCSPQQIGQLMRPMGDNTYLLFYNKPDSSQGKEVPFRQTTAAAIVTSTGPSPADPYLSNTSENFVRWDEIPPVTFFATIYSLSSECVLLYNCNSDTCKELLRYRNTVAVMEDPQRLLHQVAPKKKTGTGSKEKDVTSEKQGSTPRKRKQDTQSEGTPMHKKKCTNQEVQKWVDDKIHSILGGKAENVQSKRDQVERFRKGEMVAILPEKSEYTGTPWIGKCTGYDPKRDELDVKWYRGSYKGPWYPDNRYHQTKLPFSAVLVWGFKLTPEKTLPDSTVDMLKDVLKEHDLH